MEPLESHPIANIFPLLEGEALASLVADIRAHGLNHPITLYEGKILDGRNRYRACMEAGVAVRTQEWQGSEEEAAAFVWSENAERRDLTPGQRALARYELDSLVQEIRAKAKERQRMSPGPEKVSPRGETFSPPIHTEEHLAKLAGVGKGTMARAGVLKRKADSGNEKAAQLVEKVKAGTMPLTTAYNEMRAVAPTQPAPAQQTQPLVDETPEVPNTPLPVSWQSAHPAEMLVAALGALRRTVERQGAITDDVLAAWWGGIEWREWHAAKGDVFWFYEQCMPLLAYVSKHRNRTPPMVRELRAIDAPPEPKARRLREAREPQSSSGASWVERAEVWLAERTEPFTAEAIVADIGLPNGVAVGANKNNAVGSLIGKWSQRGRIHRVGYTPATRAESRGATLSVWLPAHITAQAPASEMVD